MYSGGLRGDGAREPTGMRMTISNTIGTRWPLLVALDSPSLALEATLSRFPMGFPGLSGSASCCLSAGIHCDE